MKKSLVIILLACCGALSAQQQAMFTEYQFNEVTLNPAYAGSHDVISATAVARRQWQGIDGAPATLSFNVHSPLRNENIGLGLSVVYDELTINKNLNIYGSASYKISFDREKHLHFGIQYGVTSMSNDFSQIKNIDAGDPNLSQNAGSGVVPNFGAGMYFYTHKFYVGLSAPQLLNNAIELGATGNLPDLERHFFFNSGYVFDLGESLKFKPTMFIKYVENVRPELDLTGSFIIKDMLTIGAAWRSFDSFDLLAGLQINEQLRVGYAYDITTTSLNQFNNGSHEIALNYKFAFSDDKIITPRHF